MKATAQANTNIAFVKYWGALDPALNLPLNDSLSLTLDQANTIVTVEFSPHVGHDTVELETRPSTGPAAEGVVRHLDRLRRLAGVDQPARVASQSTVPVATGLATSASLYAGLTVAGLAALGLVFDQRTVSTIARLGSGSAARSIFGGWVEWVAGARHEDSYARQLHPPDWWPLRDIIVIVSEEPKPVPSLAGHELAATSPCHLGRQARTGKHMALARTAVETHDLAMLGRVAEAEALLLHAVTMTTEPPALYWYPATVAVLRQVWAWRAEGLPVYFTLDAGPNVHVLTTPEHAPQVATGLCALPDIVRTLVCQPGGPPVLGDVHLF
jgi:diphosphomevalonate decarboxylase